MASNIPVIVHGNSFSLAIPLQIYYINGDQMDLQDYTPDPTDEVSVQLKGSRRNYTYTPTIDGNVANIDLTGNELADNYGVVVSVVKANGQRLRSFRTDQFFIVESSDDLTPADIIEGLEENVIYLNAQPFIAGADGRGIESIVKTGTSGLVDTYTITYSDNTTSTFNVTNGAQGEAGATIASVEKTATVGKVDTYTITMTDGNTFDFQVTNGLDGVDLGLANIVNDLTTGGATNVLSAEQGKVLKGMIDNSLSKNVDVDLTAYTAVRAWIGGGDKWIVNNNTYPYYGIFIEIPSNAKKIQITGNATYNGNYALLTTNTYSNNGAVSYATGCSKETLTAGTSAEISNIPSDAKYMWIGTYTTHDVTPTSLKFGYDVLSVNDIVNNLNEGGNDKVLSAEQGKLLNDKIDKYHVASKKTATISKQSRTVTRAYSALYPYCSYKIKVTLSAASNGATYVQGAKTTTSNTTIATIASGQTTLEFEVTPTERYIFIVLYTPSGQDHSAASVEITPMAQVTGKDNIASIIPIGYPQLSQPYSKSMFKIRVRKGNVLYFLGDCKDDGTGDLVTFSSTYGGADTSLITPNNGNTISAGFVTFDEDGYIFVQAANRGVTANFVLYAEQPINEDFVIAAANTPDNLKDFADAVCTGTNDEVVLNSALEGARIIGRKIKLLRGDYYLDAPTKNYNSTSDAFLLANTTPVGAPHFPNSNSIIVEGESWASGMHPTIHVSGAAYEALDSTKQYSMLAVYDNTNYGGHVEIKNVGLQYPWNQKKIVALDLYKYGGYARLHSIRATAYTDGYGGHTVNISNPPAVAVEGCIGIRFIGQGPNGTYGSEITDTNASGFNEGICINTEWTICTHVISIFCVTGWVFGKYRYSGSNGTFSSSATHPIVLINCGDERGVNLPYFYYNSGSQDIEMIAFSIERNAANTPGGVLGDFAKEGTAGTFRGSISYCQGQGAGNNANAQFWEYGHGHNMRTINTSQKLSGTTTERNGYYNVNYLQRFYDTTLGKELICVDEENRTWKDAEGNSV